MESGKSFGNPTVDGGKISEDLNLDPTPKMDVVYIARLLMEQKDYPTALNFYDQAISRYPENADILKSEKETCKIFLELEEDRAFRIGEMFMSYAKRGAKRSGIYQLNQNESQPEADEDLCHEQEVLTQAYRLMHGWGVTVNHEQAFQYFRESTKGKTSEAEGSFRAALMLLDGQGTKMDKPEALTLLQETALHPPVNPLNVFNKGRNIGVAESRFVLGKYCEDMSRRDVSNSDFCDVNFLIASIWYDLGHKCSHGMSSEGLGLMYHKGTGVPKSDIKAEWYLRSAVVRHWHSAYIHLASLLIFQKEVEKAKSVIENGLETDNDENIRQKLLVLFEEVTVMMPEYNTQKEAVEAFEQFNNLSRDGIPFYQRLERMQNKSKYDVYFQKLIHEIALVSTIYVNKKSDDERKDHHFIELETKHLDYLCWSNVISPSRRCTRELLEMILKYCQVMTLLDRYEKDRPSLTNDLENTTEFLSAVEDLLICYHFEIKWQKHDLFFLYTLLQEMLHIDIRAANLDLHQTLEFCLAEVGAKIDIEGSGFKYLVRAWTMNPDNIQLTITFTDYYIAKKDYVRAYMVGAEALERFPEHVNLLFSHGQLCFRALTNGTIYYHVDFRMKAIQNLLKFLNFAPVDHPQVPETYYMLGVIYFDMYRDIQGLRQMMSVVAATHFYRLGELAENQQLTYIAPYHSIIKAELKDRWSRNERTWTFMNINMNINNENSEELNALEVRELNGISVTDKENKKIKNINEDHNRILLIVSLRNKFKNELETPRFKRNSVCNSRDFHRNFRGKGRFIPSLCRKWPIMGFEVLSQEKIWHDHILKLTVIDEALSGFGLDDIHIVAEDENRNVLYIVLHHFKQDTTVQKKYGFGRKIQICSPETKFKKNGEKFVLVNDPNKVIWEDNVNNEVLCRFCLKPGAKTRCSQCRWANYCSKECQEFDWKVLKHKRICWASRPWKL